MNILRMVCAFMIGILVAGCGKPPMMTVTGSVKLDGKEVPECKVGFFPDAGEFNPDRHGFGSAVTDAQGRFEIQHPQGEKGIWAGKYKVTLEAFVTKNGKPLPANSKPSEVEGGVKNLFPDLYREPSLTKEKAVVTSGKNVFDFNIITK